MAMNIHVPLQEATDRTVERLEALGYKVRFEDDENNFKDFVGTGNHIFEGAFCALELVFYSLRNEDSTGAGIEFHIVFYTRKGKKLQRGLSKNDFQRLKDFLERTIFSPGGLKVREYDPSFRDYSRPRSNPHLFPDNKPGVEINIGGWLGRL